MSNLSTLLSHITGVPSALSTVLHGCVHKYAADSVVDGRTNTFVGLRVVNATHDFLFAEFTDVTEQYYTPAKGIGIALVIFFFLTFLACCYLCCCAKKFWEADGPKGREMKENYFARP